VKHLKNVLKTTMTAMVFMVAIKVASAQGLPPGQLPQLTGEWWQWAISIPNSVKSFGGHNREELYGWAARPDMVSGGRPGWRIS